MPSGRLESLTNEDGPEIDEGEECNICELLERKYEWKDVVRYTLRKPIQRVEGVASVWCWHDPFVVRFVQLPVNHRMMQTPVDPVDAEIREKYEQWELNKVVESKWRI